MPWSGLAIGAVAGAITGALSDYGINDDFIKEVGATIKPGGSAMFLLISKWTEDKREKQIGCAGLDVFEKEPLPLSSPLLEFENVALTPHAAFLSKESLEECTRLCVQNVENLLKESHKML